MGLYPGLIRMMIPSGILFSVSPSFSLFPFLLSPSYLSVSHLPSSPPTDSSPFLPFSISLPPPPSMIWICSCCRRTHETRSSTQSRLEHSISRSGECVLAARSRTETAFYEDRCGCTGFEESIWIGRRKGRRRRRIKTIPKPTFGSVESHRVTFFSKITGYASYAVAYSSS